MNRWFGCGLKLIAPVVRTTTRRSWRQKESTFWFACFHTYMHTYKHTYTHRQFKNLSVMKSRDRGCINVKSVIHQWVLVCLFFLIRPFNTGLLPSSELTLSGTYRHLRAPSLSRLNQDETSLGGLSLGGVLVMAGDDELEGRLTKHWVYGPTSIINSNVQKWKILGRVVMSTPIWGSHSWNSIDARNQDSTY